MFKLLFTTMLLVPIVAYSHGGRTDSSGCHNDRKNGGYHCHNSGKSAAKSYATKTNTSADINEDIKSQIINESIINYSGSCPCPYNTTSNGSRCGKRSAYSKPGGASPICYKSDISEEQILAFKKRKGY